MNKVVVTNNSVHLWPGQRAWYKALDVMQVCCERSAVAWYRFAHSNLGYAIGILLRIVFMLIRLFAAAVVIVGGFVLYMTLYVALNGLGQSRRR